MKITNFSIDTKLDNEGYYVYVPFDLKDIFKAHFKTAKWNGSKTCWEVGVRSHKKLIQFQDVIDKYKVELENKFSAEQLLEEELLTDEEIINLSCQILGIAEKISDVTDLKERLDKKLMRLNSMQQEISAAKIEIDALNEQNMHTKAEIEQRINNLVDLELVRRLTCEMSKHMKSVGQTSKDLFHDAQNEIVQQWKILRSKGFGLKALDWLANANFNRPDRDSPNVMPSSLWLELYKTNQDD